jgi:predicted DNA-binding transcriptional regulator YafY
MNLFSQINQLEQIHYHIEHKSTGSPKQFASRLNVSERTLNRIIEELQDREVCIAYSRKRNSYVYMGDHKIPGLLKSITEKII